MWMKKDKEKQDRPLEVITSLIEDLLEMSDKKTSKNT